MIENLSPTRQRLLEVLKESGKHLTADEIHLELKKNGETIGIATVYRNLNYLHDHGFLRRIKDLELGYIYDYNLHKHYHLKCRVCDTVVDVDIPVLPELNKMVEDATGAISVTHDILFEGICKECQNKVQE